MVGLNEKLDAQGLLTSMRIVRRSLGMLSAGLSEPVLEQYGDRGLAALEEAFYRWGVWRGERLRNSVEAMTDGVRPGVIVRNWDSLDFALGHADGTLVTLSRGEDVELTFTAIPFEDQLTGALAPVFDPLYRRTTEGMAAALRPEVDLTWVNFGSGGVEGRILLRGLETVPAKGAGDLDVDLERKLNDPAAAIELMRRSAISNGAFYAIVAQVVIEHFDATGEHLIRKGLREIGRRRGEVLRERHLAQGTELTVENLMNDWDGPLVSVWTFDDDITLTPDRWEQNCTWCPYAAAWQEFGRRGQELGYMYDVEMHTAVYQTYHPDITVRWDQLKTRGDATCNFRVHLDQRSQPVPLQIGRGPVRG